MLAKDPIPLSKIPDLCHMQKIIDLVLELWSPRFVTEYWNVFFSHLPCRLSKCVGIELLASVVWKRGCQPFSCRCLQNVTHCPKEICSTCLFKEPIPAIPFGNSKHPNPTRSSRFLSAAARSNSSALWLHHAHPFVAVAWKTCLIEISRGFGHGVVVLKICSMQWLCSQLFYVTAANQWSIVEIEVLAFVGWKCGCQPFSWRCSQNVTHCRKEICSKCLFKESIPATPFGNFNYPLPARSRVLRAAARSTTFALWLHHVHPFVAAAEKDRKNSREAEGFVTELWSPRFVTMQWLCCQLFYVTAANQWTIVEIEPLAIVGWKWGCQPFSCPCSQNVTQCQTRFGRHVRLRLRHQFPPFLLGIPSIHSLPEAGSWERQYVRQLCNMLALCLQKIPSLCRRFRICVICRKS